MQAVSAATPKQFRSATKMCGGGLGQGGPLARLTRLVMRHLIFWYINLICQIIFNFVSIQFGKNLKFPTQITQQISQ